MTYGEAGSRSGYISDEVPVYPLPYIHHARPRVPYKKKGAVGLYSLRSRLKGGVDAS